MTKWNLLPDDVIYRIYQFKHQFDMKDSIRTIEQFRYRTFEQSNVYFNRVTPIKDLLKTDKDKENIYIYAKKDMLMLMRRSAILE